MGWFANLREKLNPAQEDIVRDYGDNSSSSSDTYSIQSSYNTLECIRRGTDLIVNSAANIKLEVQDKVSGSGILDEVPRKKKLEKILISQPNPFISADMFYRNVYLDIVLEGNAFIYYDGAHLYNLPASSIEVISDNKKFINKYVYGGKTDFYPKEVIHIRDNNGRSIFRGISRLGSAKKSIDAMHNMVDFQNNFFKNGAVPGLVIKSPDVLGKKIKDRILTEWMQKYNPKTGGRRPMVLDGGFEIDKLGNTNFRELGFEESITSHENKILKALGVPPVLLNSGNNANITPNLKLFYLTTALPLVEMVISSFEHFFGYNLKPNTREVLALRPELRDEAAYYSTLVNTGILTRNEAREKLRFESSDQEFADELVMPANIAGSALPGTSNSGGAPKKEGNNEK